jgi:uncharacterized protein (DUF1499 family)
VAVVLLLLLLLLLLQFYFPPGDKSVVEYRSASRIGESDGNINRCAGQGRWSGAEH